MLRELLQNKKRLFFIGLALMGLILVRAFEDTLFYDPFLNFFKGAYTSKAIPEVLEWKLYLSLFIKKYKS